MLSEQTRMRLIDSCRTRGAKIEAGIPSQQLGILQELAKSLAKLEGVSAQVYPWNAVIAAQSVQRPRLSLTIVEESFSLDYLEGTLHLCASYGRGIPVTGKEQLLAFVDKVKEELGSLNQRSLRREKIRGLRERALAAAIEVVVGELGLRYELRFLPKKAKLTVTLSTSPRKTELEIDLSYDSIFDLETELRTLLSSAMETAATPLAFILRQGGNL